MDLPANNKFILRTSFYFSTDLSRFLSGVQSILRVLTFLDYYQMTRDLVLTFLSDLSLDELTIRYLHPPRTDYLKWYFEPIPRGLLNGAAKRFVPEPGIFKDRVESLWKKVEERDLKSGESKVEYYMAANLNEDLERNY